ncbi:hypothetical protein Bbelb_359440 [Branchiostoma belcheri]|nr:hypothetical protein Bbelb_359440 [Branchiostoma belcheri]
MTNVHEEVVNNTDVPITHAHALSWPLDSSSADRDLTAPPFPLQLPKTFTASSTTIKPWSLKGKTSHSSWLRKQVCPRHAIGPPPPRQNTCQSCDSTAHRRVLAILNSTAAGELLACDNGTSFTCSVTTQTVL